MKSTRSSAEEAVVVLGAFCLFLSTLEYMLPKPLPFIRLGLANVPLMLGLSLPPAFFINLVLIKVLAQALLSGTLFSYIFLFSLAGTGASAFFMYILNRLCGGGGGRRLISFTGIGCAGSFVFNMSQLAFSYFFILGRGTVYVAPAILLFGVVSGTALGLWAEMFAAKSLWYKEMLTGGTAVPSGAAGAEAAASAPGVSALSADNSKKDIAFFCGGLFCLIVFFMFQKPFERLLFFIVFWILALALKRAKKPLFTLAVFMCIVFFNILSPYGRVLLKIGAFPLTEGALLEALKKAATMEGLIMLSKIAIPRSLKLPFKTGRTLGRALEVLSYFEANRNKISLRNFTGDVDALLMGAGRDCPP